MSTALELPLVEPVIEEDDDDDSIHLVCCDVDLALCGEHVPGDDFGTGVDRGEMSTVNCSVCSNRNRLGLPCDYPDCPARSS